MVGKLLLIVLHGIETSNFLRAASCLMLLIVLHGIETCYIL